MPLTSMLATARILLSLIILAYASWSDYKSREVSNTLWLFYGPPAFALTLVELFLNNFSNILVFGLCFSLTTIFVLIIFYAGGFGGADAKALICLALALPFYPENAFTPISERISPIAQNFFPLTVFNNSVLLAAATAIFILLYNIAQHKRKGEKLFSEFEGESVARKALALVTGYKMPINRLREKWHLYPLEDIEEDVNRGFRRRLLTIPRDEERSCILGRLERAVEEGRIGDMVWATPGLPMLIYMTVGLVIALLFGDVIWMFIDFIL